MAGGSSFRAGTVVEGVPRLLFASYHSLIDPSSGAAISALHLLELLHARGWAVQVFCGPVLDFEQGAAFEEDPAVGRASRSAAAQLLSDQGAVFQRRVAPPGFPAVSVLHFRSGAVPGMVFEPAAGSSPPPPRRRRSGPSWPSTSGCSTVSRPTWF